MPKRGKSGKNRKKKAYEEDKRELILKEDGQEYAQVMRMLGNGRLEGACFDGKRRLCNIRGKMRRKVWINQGDIVLVSLRDFQDDKADVVHKYTPEEARRLRVLNEIPENAKIAADGEADGAEDDDCVFDFEEI